MKRGVFLKRVTSFSSLLFCTRTIDFENAKIYVDVLNVVVQRDNFRLVLGARKEF